MNETAPASAQPPSGAPKPAPILWGRIISLVGAGGLCVSFFLPQIVYNVIYGTGGEELRAYAPASLAGVGTILVGLCLPFIVAIVLLPVLIGRAWPRVDEAKIAGKFLAWADCAVCLSVLLVALGWLTYAFVPVGLGSSYASPVGYALVPVGVGTLAMALVAMFRSPLLRKAAAAQFALWAYYLVYFIYTATCQDVLLAGMWVSITACGLLTLGAAIDWFQCRPAKETPR